MRLHAFETGRVAVRERQRRGVGHGRRRLVNTLLDRRWTEPLPILAWAIEHPEGLIVVDTGETARTAEPGYFPRWHPYFRLAVRLFVEPQDEIGPAMRRAGLDPADVPWVVLTHMHTDHAGGLHHFPDSEVIVSTPELELASGFMGKLRGYVPHRLPPWLQPRTVTFDADPWEGFPASIPLTSAGDVRLVPTPGHTPGHLSVVAETDDRLVVFAGDATYSEEILLEQVVDGVAPDERVAKETLARLLDLADRRPIVYLPSHDPDAVRRLTQQVPVGR